MNRIMMGWVVLGWVAICAAGVLAAGGPVALPAGQTSLADVGIYQIGYQSYGKEAVEMPASWVGTDEASGIMYRPGERVDRKSVV